jgi:uncharacterized membrane protein
MATTIPTNGAEPVYGPGSMHERSNPQETAEAQSPPYTAPYPPYPSDVPPTYAIAPNVASGLAYFTLLPAIVFLLVEPYRSNSQVRFHSWQSIGLFVAIGIVRSILAVMGAALPPLLMILLNSVLSLIFLAAWLVAMLQAFSGKKYLLPVIGPFVERL